MNALFAREAKRFGEIRLNVAQASDSLDAFVALVALSCARSHWLGYGQQDRRKTCVRLIVFGRLPPRR
jgi:hypothetical protein